MKLNMVATKPMRYGTRRLVAGDTFECEPRHAKLFVTLKRAKEHEREKADIPAIPAALKERVTAPQSADAQQDERATLRAAYETKFGKRPYMGWSAEDLRRRIAEAAA